MFKSLNFKDFRKQVIDAFGERVRIITAGLSLDELRALLRGDPPTEKPNPRYRVHVTSFLFHIRPKFYQRASTIFTHTWRLGFFTFFFFALEVVTRGADGLFFASQTTNEGYLTPDEYDEFAKRYDLVVLEAVRDRSWFNIFHLHGKDVMLDSVLDYPVQAFN